MRKYLVLLLFSSLAPLAAQTTAEQADNAYLQGKYEEAISLYEEVSATSQNADVYYNLGNAYYRTEDLGKAILNYERALLLSPSDEDIRYNLELCRLKTTDRFNLPSEMFFITWFKSMVYGKNANQWGNYALVLFCCFLGFAGMYKFANRLLLRKTGFSLAAVSLLGCISFNIFATMSHYAVTHDDRAVVLKEASLYPSNSGKDEAILELHPGTVVQLKDKNSRGWGEVVLPNRKAGWMRLADVSSIVE